MPTPNRRMDEAARLVSDARYAAFGRLDADIMLQQAPWAALYNNTVRELVSSRVGCHVFQPSMAHSTSRRPA